MKKAYGLPIGFLAVLMLWAGCVYTGPPGIATPCDSDQECAEGNVCIDGLCGAPGGTTGTTGSGTGGGMDCREGSRALCDGECVNLQNDAYHCGTCDNNCGEIAANSQPFSCVEGACKFYPCDYFDDHVYFDCDGDIGLGKDGTGCETHVPNDPQNCGACGHVCADGDTCDEGLCHAPCALSEQFCKGACQSIGYATCFGCDSGCKPAPNVVEMCLLVADGEPAPACLVNGCKDGYTDCDGDVMPGAKVKLNQGPGPGNGCETHTDVDPQNCGACDNVCPAGETCDQGACKPAGGCLPTEKLVNGNCVPTDSDHGCSANTDQPCPTPPNVVSVFCSGPNNMGGSCTFTCKGPSANNLGFANCDGNAMNGCEQPVDNQNCGDMCAVCGVNQVCAAEQDGGELIASCHETCGNRPVSNIGVTVCWLHANPIDTMQVGGQIDEPGQPSISKAPPFGAAEGASGCEADALDPKVVACNLGPRASMTEIWACPAFAGANACNQSQGNGAKCAGSTFRNYLDGVQIGGDCNGDNPAGCLAIRPAGGENCDHFITP